MQSIAELLPVVGGAGEAVIADCADPAVESRPHHDPRMGEVHLLPPHLPDPVVTVVEMIFREGQQGLLQRPGEVVLLLAVAAQLLQGHHDLAHDVGLVLGHGAVTDPDRR